MEQKIEELENDSFIKDITVKASIDNMHYILGVAEEMLGNAECPMPVITQFLLSIEEVYVNVASYAYGDGEGDCRIRYEICENGKALAIDLWDEGIPFDPLAKEDPDITLKAEERKIGGLGILMTKTMMDEIKYSYEDGKNHLYMKKAW